MTSVKDPNSNITTYAYNANNWLTTLTNAHNNNTTFAYDDVGQLTSKTDFASRQTTYSYNRIGWRTGETWVSGSYTATYSYNAGGQLTDAVDTNSVYKYTYTNDGVMNQQKVSYPGASSMGTVTLDFTIDGFGRRTRLADSTATSGVMIYLTNGATVNIANGANVNMTAESSGSYQGILFYQDRTMSSPGTSLFTGGSAMHLTGSLYFPNSALTFDNGGNAQTQAIVASTVSFQGGATLNQATATSQTGLYTSSPSASVIE